MKNGDKEMKIRGLIVILMLVLSVFGGVVSAENVSEDLAKSIADAEIQATLDNASSDELAKYNIVLDEDPLRYGLYSSQSCTLYAVADGYAWSGGTENPSGASSTADYLRVGFKTASGNYRTLIKFDLSSIPTGATITSADLKLYYHAYGGAAGYPLDISVYRTTVDWNEGYLSWSKAENYNSFSYDTATIIAGGGAGYKTWDITSLVQNWVDGTYSNYGILLRAPTQSGSTIYRQFRSKEYGSNVPKLVVTYTEIPDQPPDPPTPLSPGSSTEPGPEVDTLTPTLEWASVSNADYYALAISEYPYGPSHVIHNPQQLYGTSYTVPSGVLEHGRKYRWNMQAHNSAGWSDISNTLYFQTPLAVQPPTVETWSATSVTETAATLNGVITNDGGSSIIERRFDWGTTPSCSDGWTNSVTVSGNSFSYRRTGLQPNTVYYFRAWAKNSADWSHGNVLHFTTLSQNQPPTLSSGYVTPSSGDTSTTFNYYVTYADSDGDAPTTKYVYVNGSPHTMTKISGSYTSGATFKYSTTLSAGNYNYYFYFNDGHGHTKRLPTSETYSGPSVSQPIQLPQVSTNSASNIGTSSATLNGNLDATGGETCQVWFEWGLTTSYGHSTTKQSKSTTGSFSSQISGLQSGKTYHFKACASNSKGTVCCSDRSFTTNQSVTDHQKQQEILNMVNSHRGSIPAELVLAIIRQEGGEGAFHVDGWNYNSFYKESDGPWAQPTNGDGIMQVTLASGYHEKSGPYTHDRNGYDHAINDGCDYLLELYNSYGSRVQITLHYNTGPNSLYIYLGKNQGDWNYLSHVAEHLSNFVPNTYGLQNPNLVSALNQGQNILSDYLYNKGLATEQSVDYYRPYQEQLDKELHNIGHPPVKDLQVPYIHQCWDTPNDFDGRWACGATSAVMVLAYYEKIDPWPCECSLPYSHTSDFGNYICRSYTYNSYTFDTMTPDASGNSAYGAYGYIHYSDGLAKLGRMVDYFQKHELDSWEKYNPSESQVKAELDAGYPVPASTKLTLAGHWIVIKGYTNDGYYIVNDPYGSKPYGSGICGNYNGADVLYTWDEMKVNEKWVAIVHPITDTVSPTVDAFDVTPRSLILGNAFTISYTVSDTGGSGLSRVELWRKYETGNWEEIDATSLSGVGNGPYSDSFSDAPPAIGTYQYGIHVLDKAGHMGLEPDPPGPIEVKVTLDCDGTDTSCGIYPNCENCNADDGCYAYGNGCEIRDYYCYSNEVGCDYTYSNRHTDGWYDTGNKKWVTTKEYECKYDQKEQKEQQYRDYYCSGGSCTYKVTKTQWIDTGKTQAVNKPDGTDCGSDGWFDTGNKKWVTTKEYECKYDQKEQKEQQYRDYYCSGGSCTYKVTKTQWIDTGRTKTVNKPDGTDCGSDGWFDTGNKKWVTTKEYECKYDQKEQKEQKYRDYYCSGGSCTYKVTKTQWIDTGKTKTVNKPDGTDCGSDGWFDTGNKKWVTTKEYECKYDQKEQKEQQYRDYYCSGGSCTYKVTKTQWIDTGKTKTVNKPDGTICSCTPNNTLKRCYGGTCSNTGICNSTHCNADSACDGKKPGEKCGTDSKCNFNCKCVSEPALCTDPDPPSHNFGNVPEGGMRSWTFAITNCGGGTLTWTISADKTWITVSPTSGSTTETDKVTVTIDTTGLSGQQSGTISISSAGGNKQGIIEVYVELPPSVSISTDKYEYNAGETMLINLTIANPADKMEPVYFAWRLDLPDYDLHYWIMIKALYLPSDYEQTFTIPLTLGDYGFSFNASWYVALYNTTILEVLSEDTANWRYVSSATAQGGVMPAEIAREITKEFVEIELPNQDAQKWGVKTLSI